MQAQPEEFRGPAHPGFRLKIILHSLALLGLLSACDRPGTHETTARQFLDLYLVASDQKAALSLCSGRAKAELQKEIDLLAGLDDREAMVAQLRPTLRLEKIFEQRRPGGDVAFLFRVDLKRGDVEVPSSDVFVLVGAPDGVPRVKSFSFDPSESRTPGTP